MVKLILVGKEMPPFLVLPYLFIFSILESDLSDLGPTRQQTDPLYTIRIK